MEITYLGHSCLLVAGAGRQIIIDPFLSGNPSSGVDPADIQADAVVLTHGHSDHFGDALQIARHNNCPIIAIFELAMFCQERGAQVHDMNIGGSHLFDGYSVTYTPAFHSSSVSDGERRIYAGSAAGVLIKMAGKTLFHAGDTALFSDLKLIGELHPIDIAALPIGDNYTMGPNEAAIAAEWLQTRHVVPIHYNTFPAIRQNADDFAELLTARGIQCHVLQSKESVLI